MGTVRVVLDTNVLVSALGFGGSPLEALLSTFDEDVQLLASEQTLDELQRVMRYDRLHFSKAERTQYLTILRSEAEIVQPDTDLSVVRDPDDDKFLEVAVHGAADYLVSGDQDLIVLGSYEDVDVVSPDEFAALFD